MFSGGRTIPLVLLLKRPRVFLSATRTNEHLNSRVDYLVNVMGVKVEEAYSLMEVEPLTKENYTT